MIWRVFLKLCITFNFFAFQNTESSGDVIAPIATPEKSRSSSGDTLEEIKEETEAVIIKNNPCATTESSTNSEASIIASKPSSSSTVKNFFLYQIELILKQIFLHNELHDYLLIILFSYLTQFHEFFLFLFYRFQDWVPFHQVQAWIDLQSSWRLMLLSNQLEWSKDLAKELLAKVRPRHTVILLIQ